MSELEWMETRRRYTDGRYEVDVTEWDDLDGERRTAVTVKDEGREIFHTGSAKLKSFEPEDVEEYLRLAVELRDVLADFVSRKRAER